MAILVAISFAPAKAEARKHPGGKPSATAYARAKIYNRIEIGSAQGARGRNQAEQQLPDISVDECHSEAKKLIEHCTLIILEMH
ncbi:hypothetical protein [Sphingorhabdus sp. Alg231-15]|uniref:hypothetical protein n=1 Tax=Sphingorhabdus sp. Alg231-15 TaxID=1922222 RepID=UPI000D55156C